MARPKMPRTARAKRFRRRGGRRSGPARSTTVTVNRSLQPIPQRYICKMKYCETNVTSAVTGQYVYNLNSIFDPDRSGIGHQPYGFDNLALLYNRYRVIKCGWRIESPIGDGTDFRAVHAIPSNDPSITWNTAGYIRENPRCKYVTCNPGAPAKTLSGWVSLPSLMGRNTQQYMADDTYSATVLANPAETALLYVFTSNVNGNPISAPIQVTLEYTVEFFDIKHVLQS